MTTPRLECLYKDQWQPRFEGLVITYLKDLEDFHLTDGNVQEFGCKNDLSALFAIGHIKQHTDNCGNLEWTHLLPIRFGDGAYIFARGIKLHLEVGDVIRLHNVRPHGLYQPKGALFAALCVDSVEPLTTQAFLDKIEEGMG